MRFHGDLRAGKMAVEGIRAGLWKFRRPQGYMAGDTREEIIWGAAARGCDLGRCESFLAGGQGSRCMMGGHAATNDSSRPGRDIDGDASDRDLEQHAAGHGRTGAGGAERVSAAAVDFAGKANQILGSTMPCCAWYLPFLSL